jgi:hypothetical protein
VAFDLKELAFMDGSGIALLLQVSNKVGSVEFRRVTPSAYGDLEVTGLLAIFGLAP